MASSTSPDTASRQAAGTSGATRLHVLDAILDLAGALRGEVEKMAREIVREEIAAAIGQDRSRPDREILTTDEAAEIARVKPATIRAWTRSGKLPAHRTSEAGQLRVRRSDLEQSLTGTTTPGIESDEAIDKMAVQLIRRRPRRGSDTDLG
jgi:excisionase family DNA binding protein